MKLWTLYKQSEVEANYPLNFDEIVFPGLPQYKNHGNHRKSYMVIYENNKVIESAVEVYGNKQVVKRPYCSMIQCDTYTVP